GWDRSWTNSNAPWQLSLVAGATFNGSDQQLQAPGSVSPSTDQRNYYAMAMLQVPLQELGVPWTKKRREAQSNREAQSQDTEAHAAQVASSDQSSAEKNGPAASQPAPAESAPTQPDPTPKSQSRSEIASFPLGSTGTNSEGLQSSSARAKQARAELISLVKKL